MDEIPEQEQEPEPVPEADEPVEPVPEISAAAPVSADDTATPPPGALPDLGPSEAAAGERTSDLVRLPGAGPGLIWMLNECEIHTLADLAAADCTDLTARMGLAGRILDLGGWIAFARAAEVR
ncbi:hypothetical protein FBT96_14280 [Rhodobacter capsulatus]|uniref:Uncharacterized protein n=1 Tax=Rhodobacter capsulatus TaxID=1061 RepID=A0A4V5PNZ8_RHOCA|nr:hypothetical protein FBT96_14280 [Rhodobacter capsulatus]